MVDSASELTLEDLAASVDTFYLLFCGSLVFFMQAGFGMLEAGAVRSKNTKNILLKNMLDACIGAAIWWSIGYGIAYSGTNKFIGTATETSSGEDAGGNFFMLGQAGAGEDPSGRGFIKWFFQYVFAAAAATIVSGAVAERCALLAYFVYTVVITAFIYPVVVHWVWSQYGWASTANEDRDDAFLGGTIDFAGSGVVHLTGGVCAFWGSWAIGPRRGRFDSDQRPVPLPGHSSVLQVLGTLILWLGWYGFNPGSTLGISRTLGKTAARACVCTTLSAAGGGISVILLDKIMGSKIWEVTSCCNGVLAGLVSITAGCATMTTHSAFCTGLLGGFVYFGSSKVLLNKLKIDDALNAFPVHGACGVFGMIANGFLADDHYTRHYYNWCHTPPEGGDCPEWDGSYAGVLYGGHKVLGAGVVTSLAIIAWVSTLSSAMFMSIKYLGILRVSAEMEDAGMDVSKHGGPYTSSMDLMQVRGQQS